MAHTFTDHSGGEFNLGRPVHELTIRQFLE